MKKVLMYLAAGLLSGACLAACGKKEASSLDVPKLSLEESDKDLDYTYGEGATFHSNEPVEYPLMYNDHESYPEKDDWRLWSAIKERSNVTFKLTSVPRIDYNQKVSAAVNSGSAPYIVSKIYGSDLYEDSGQIVAVSDWVKYMPNYEKQVEDWGMQDDLNTITDIDGKYWRLPGMWETTAGGYSLIIRKDVFEAAGVDMSKETSWTWEDFYDALKKVKQYTGAAYVWSDQYQLGCAMNLAAIVYGVKAGRSTDGGDWGLQDGTKFDHDKGEFYFPDTTEDYKEYLKYFCKLFDERLIDPETVTQDGDQARAKFFRGDSYVLTGNYQTLADILATDKMQVDGAELYFLTTPSGPKGNLKLSSGSGRLENGLMISKSAPSRLGEKDFIKMLRFIDWLWYSDEGHTLTQWGVEGETYTKDGDGNIVLNPDIYYNGFNPGAKKMLNADYGFGGGVFAYGGSKEIQYSKFTEGEKEWNQRIDANKVNIKLDPPLRANEEEKEDLNLIKVPLSDYLNTAALEFITGKRDIGKDWDAYVKECETKGSVKYIDMKNKIYKRTSTIKSMAQ